MKVNRIKRIKDHRVFRDFSWPSGLDDFRRFNLIYGWNGSGKTSLSTLFRHLQDRRPVVGASVQFVCDGAEVDGGVLGPTSNVPDVRVFNRDFVAANVSSSSVNMQPIFFLGKESVEKQKKVAAKREILEKRAGDLNKAEAEQRDAVAQLDALTVEHGRAIKLLLSSSGGTNPYNNYDKRSYKAKADAFKGVDCSALLLDEPGKNALKQTIASSPKDAIATMGVAVPDAEPIRERVDAALAETVVSSALTELSNDGEVADWVKSGLVLHSGSRATKDCRFCGQTIPPTRREALEGHFNDAYERFIAGIDSLLNEVGQAKLKCRSVSFLDRAVFYDTLKDGYDAQHKALRAHLAETAEYLNALESALTEKRSKPFERMSLEARLAGRTVPTVANGVSALKAINQLIGQHNDQTNNFQAAVTEARKKLEECLVAESIASYKSKCEAVEAAGTAVGGIRQERNDLAKLIAELEKDIVEHRQPADELNRELRSYLGRDELKFDVKETGYSITRGGVPATELSEGERTAIAFLYFLKSLHDKGFKIADGVVVIDDPISSLDTNALFAAFGFMKERTKDAGQLFVLTHSFAFFRQVKNWYRHIKNKKHDVRFYKLEASYVGVERNASLGPLDNLLIDYESEYHYLFDRVYKHSTTAGGGPLEVHYEIPNIARRLLESFLSFRFPSEAGELHQQLEKTKASVATKTRIIRFLHTYSHDGKISEPEHDLSVLAETPAVLCDLLDLIKQEDPAHYAEMESLVGVLASPGAPVVVATPAVAPIGDAP